MLNKQQLPNPFPPPWVSDWGEDEYGLWIGLTYDGVRQGCRWIPPGRFLMGSPENEKGRSDDEKQHEVILTTGYWLADTPVTQAFWEAVMGDNPSLFKGVERPVDNVSWEDAQKFMQRVSQEEDELELRFPTEAQWEHACRAGSQTPFSFGDNITSKQVNCDGNYPYKGGQKGEYRQGTVAVKALPTNNWGLYQMHGNVWEWCADWYGEYPSGVVTNPINLESGANRVLRGGSWLGLGRYVRSADRGRNAPGYRHDLIGFRFSPGQASR